jgi:hypothetical protein
MKKNPPPVVLYTTAAESAALFRRHIAKQAALRVLAILRHRHHRILRRA